MILYDSFLTFWAWHGKVWPRYSSKMCFGFWVYHKFNFAIKQTSCYTLSMSLGFKTLDIHVHIELSTVCDCSCNFGSERSSFFLTGLNIPVGSVSPPDSWRNSLPSSFRTHIIAVQVIKFHHTLSRWIKLPRRAAPGRAVVCSMGQRLFVSSSMLSLI